MKWVTEENFYVYQGSLTRPECTGDYTWIVAQKEVFVSKDNAKKISAIFSDTGKNYLNGNARFEQQIQDRKIYMKTRPDPSSATYLTIAISSVLGLAATML